MINFLCPSCKTHFKEVLEILDTLNIPYLLDHYLVRGLDYYSRTVFEFFLDEKENEKSEPAGNLSPLNDFAVGGGGRYDYLSKVLSNKDVPAVGMQMGAERVIMALHEKKLLKQRIKTPKIFFIQIGALAKRKSLLLTEMFRKAGIPIAQSVTKDSFKSQLKIAGRLGTPLILILGQKEALEETVIIRDLGLGGQDIIPFSETVEFVKNKLKEKKHG